MHVGRAGLAAVLLLVGAACGKDGPPPPPTAPEVFVRAMKALEAGSLAALDPCLSPAGREQVKRDLEAWRKVLVDPVEGPRLLSRRPSGPLAPQRAVVEKAIAGDLASLLSLYVAVEPHPWGDVPPPPVPSTSPAEYRYRAANGAERRVILVKRGDAWAIDLLTL